MKLIITGGAGFIGSNFIYYELVQHPEDEFVCLDKLTYAGNLSSLKGAMEQPNFKFVRGDIADRDFVYNLFAAELPDVVVNFAAESHVDRSILEPELFLKTNVIGTGVLMDACRKYGIKRYHQVSTDEVYGDLPLDRPDLFFYGNNAAAHVKPVFCQQGKCGFAGACISQNLWFTGNYFALQQQLRSVSFSGKADTFDDYQRLA